LLLPSGKLVHNGLMVIGSRRNWSTLSEDDFLSMTPEVPLSIANIVLGISYTELPSGSLRLIEPSDSLEDSSLSEETLDRIQRAVEFEQILDSSSRSDNHLAEKHRIILLYGPPGAGKRRAARIIAARLGKKLLRIRTSRFLMHDCDDFEEVSRVLDHADVSRAVPCFTLAERLLDDDLEDGLSESFADAFAEFGNTVILTVIGMPELTGNLGKHVTHLIPVPLPPVDQRISIIGDSIPEGLPLAPDLDLRGIADRLELSSARLKRAVKSACLRADTRKGQERELRITDFFPSAGLVGYGSPLPPEKTSMLTYPMTKLDDVVLPDGVLTQVRQIISAARVQEIVFNQWGFGDAYRTGQGISVLFSGPSGTGKTLTAEAIAHELGLPMRVVLLSGMMDKYVGETEKHTAEVFRTASTRKEVLVFDEADALFAARVSGSEEGSYYTNSHINTLLREMDVFTGIVILTTNRFPEMDRAFERRIRWKLEFPSPDAHSREMLWRKLLPGKAPVDEDIDFGALARDYILTGGLIRSAALKAAFSAAA
ncbi:MAG: AAA family ATPase, partial [Methanotrichaceae archaeon]|nr:AAA family ATPase [Methanotrichaceae archaeon]